MYLYIRGGWTNVVWGGLMAVWGGLMAVWVVWWRFGVVWWRFGVVWGVSMDRHQCETNTMDTWT